MTFWQKIKNFSLLITEEFNVIYAGSVWGESNPNYEGCDGKAFVHIRASGARFVHPEHIIKSHFAKQNLTKGTGAYRVAPHFTNFAQEPSGIKPLSEEFLNLYEGKTSQKREEVPPSIKLGGERVFLEEE